MNKIFKGIFIFLMLFVGMFICKNCNALNMNNENTGLYFTFINSNGRNFSDEFVIYTIGSRVVYCIEPGTTIGTTGYYESSLDYLSEEKKNKILDYMYYGYNYYNQYDLGYYLATQSLIWEELLDYEQEVVVSTQLFKKGDIIDITPYKNAIINTMNFYRNQFKGEVYNTILRENIDINDYTLNYLYDISCNQEGINVSVMHNTIQIRDITKAGRYQIDIIERPFYYHDYIVYKNDTKQNLILQGDIPRNMQQIYVDVAGGSLNIHKTNEKDEVLEGVSFGVYNSNNELLNQGSTDINGDVSFNQVYPLGLYYIRELTTPISYEKNNSRMYFEIKRDNLIVNMNVINFKIKGRFIISKKDKDTNIPIADTTYAIYDENHNRIDEITTNKNGLAEIELEYGKYYYQEIKANDAYEIDDTLYELNIKKTNTYSKVLYNSKIKANFIINKKDIDTNESIENTTFRIYDNEMNVIDEITTNEEGIASIELEYGDYYYQEVISNELYEIDDNIYSFQIINKEDYLIEVYNKKIPEEYDLLIIENVPNTGIYNCSLLFFIIGVIVVKKIY